MEKYKKYFEVGDLICMVDEPDTERRFFTIKSIDQHRGLFACDEETGMNYWLKEFYEQFEMGKRFINITRENRKRMDIWKNIK